MADDAEVFVSPTKISIYGASDDIVVIERGGAPVNEVDCFDQDVRVVIDEATAGSPSCDGIVLIMRYVESGTWSAEVQLMGEGRPIPWPISIGHDGYTVVVDIDASSDTAMAWETTCHTT